MDCRQCGSSVRRDDKFCPMCGNALLIQSEDAQVKSVSPSARGKYIAAGIVLVLIIGIYVFTDQLLRTYHPVIEDQPTVAMTSVYNDQNVPSTPVQASLQDGFIVLPLKLVREYRLVRFSDPEGLQAVPIIAYVTPQGRLVTAMSKSENCGSTDFYLKENNIHCASCPSYWNMSSLEAYACCQRYYPDPIPSAVVNDDIKIAAATVRSWRSRL